jgi:hypothetical protein
MHVCSDLWVSESASELRANRKNASWEGAAELTLFVDFGLSCLEYAASGELLLAKRGIFWADLCHITNYLLDHTVAAAPPYRFTTK